MSRHETLLPYDFSSLVTQPSEKQIICSACTLINALTLSGAIISPSETQSLISNVEQSRQPLELQQVHDFAQQHDSVIKFIPLPDKVTDITELVDVFTKAISKGPAMIAISTLLSKRNPTVPSRHEDQLSKKHRGKPIVHRVASIIDDNTVFIIDPYSPGDPELFDVTIREEKIRLAAWLFSVYFQKYPQSTSSHESRETLIPEALARLSNPKFIESENNLQLCKIEARIEQLTSLK